jgi:hypothetical protein
MNDNNKIWFITLGKQAHLGAGKDIEDIIGLFCENIEQAQDLFKKVPGIKRDFPYELRPGTKDESKMIENIILDRHPNHFDDFKIRGYFKPSIMKWNKEKLYFTKE